MPDLIKDIEAYESMRKELEANRFGKWVVFHDTKLHGEYETFESAAEDAVKNFGRGPYLIRCVGAPPPVLPASILYRPVPALP